MTAFNAASRIRWLMDQVRAGQNGVPAIDGWARIFDVDEPRPSFRAAEVARLLCLVQKEVDFVRERLIGAKVAPDAFRRLSAVESVIQTQNLSLDWAKVRSPLNDETVEGLIALPTLLELIAQDDEPEIDAEAFSELRDHVGFARAAVEAANLPPVVRQFLHRQLDAVLRAIREYPIRGAAAFAEAAQKSGAEFVEFAPDLEKHKDEPAVRQVHGVWKKAYDKVVRRIGQYMVWGTLATHLLNDLPESLERVKGWQLPPAKEVRMLMPPAEAQPDSTPIELQGQPPQNGNGKVTVPDLGEEL